ncbi:MAG: Hpt domain-containing protein [Magnetococcales bacterium]|nr:Hpt domain-containing protein [Magnetococcales bacterium]
MSDVERVTVVIDKDLEDIVPGYLVNRQKDLAVISKALQEKDFQTIQTSGHRMKGSGSGYGFDCISEIGRDLEIAAKEHNSGQIAGLVADLATYIESVDIEYEEV